MKNRVSEIEIKYKERVLSQDWSKVGSSNDASLLLYHNWNMDTIALYETFKVLLLNNSNKVKGCYQLSQGGLTATVVDLRLLFSVVLKSLAVAIILCHNHPSGCLKPSDADIQLTKRILEAAKFLDIKVLDHLILVPDGSFYSFADNGLI